MVSGLEHAISFNLPVEDPQALKKKELQRTTRIIYEAAWKTHMLKTKGISIKIGKPRI